MKMNDKKQKEKLIKYFGYQFRESEAVQVMLINNKELRFEIGQLKSDISELEYQVSQLQLQLQAQLPQQIDDLFLVDYSELTKAQIKVVNRIQNEMNQKFAKYKDNIKDTIIEYKEKIRKLKNNNDSLVVMQILDRQKLKDYENTEVQNKKDISRDTQ